MAHITLLEKPVNTIGALPKVGSQLKNFDLAKNDFSRTSLQDFEGKRIILNVFPSIETGVCSASVRAFNKAAADLDNTVVLCISRDLPITQAKFCATEGIENAITLSDFATGQFGHDYQLTMVDGLWAHLLSRAVIVADETGKVIYTEQVPEVATEPDYEKALAALK